MRIAISGMGSVCAHGEGVPSLWRGILSGQDAMQRLRRFSIEGMPSPWVGAVPQANDTVTGELPSWELTLRFALIAAREAWHSAGLDSAGFAPQRLALVLGTSLGDQKMPLHRITEMAAAALAIRGPALTVSTACTSSTNALGLGLDLLRHGWADAVLAGGSDTLTPIMVAGFHSLGVLSSEKCAPFSHPFGTTLGEGAAFLVLEREETARRRHAKVTAWLSGYGLSGDAFHETSPDPTGSGVARAFRSALKHAGLGPENLGYVNAHGTGTLANDQAEWRAMEEVFGARAATLPISSSKSYFGHAQGAAGSLESVVTLLSLREQVVPPTLHGQAPRRTGPDDPIFDTAPRPHAYQHAVCTNSAFGGANAAVVLSRELPGEPEPILDRPTQIPERTLYVSGLAALGSHGLTVASLRERFELEHRLIPGRIPEFFLEKELPQVDPRGLDPSSRFLIKAAANALQDAGLGVTRKRRDTIGLVLGVNQVSPESGAALSRSIAEQGLALLSAAAFSRMVLNAPAGSCSKALGLGGPLSTLSVGAGSGLMALIYAATLLNDRDEITAMLAAGLEEMSLSPTPQDDTAENSEGIACVLLSRFAPDPPDRTDRAVILAGWSLAGPGDGKTAARNALIHAGLNPGQPDLHVEAKNLGPGNAYVASAGLVAAAAILRQGRHRNILITCDSDSASEAVVLAAA